MGSTNKEEEKSPVPEKSENTNVADAADTNDGAEHTNPFVEDSKDQGDDGGEELVGEEDTVIY